MTVLTRPLSDLEHLLRCRTASGLYRSFQVTATYSQELTIPVIFASLKKTLLQYPSLVCNVRKGSTDCFFEPIQSATLKDVLEILPDTYLSDTKVSEQFMKYANTTEFSLYSGKPLFKLFLVGKFTLTIVLEHTIADGLVGPYFHEILLDNIKIGNIVDDAVSLDSELFNFSKDRLEMNSLPPPIDWFMESYKEEEKEAEKEEEEETSSSSPSASSTSSLWPGRFHTTRNTPISFKLINFTPAQVQTILAKCKLEKVTVTTYIQVVQLLTLAPVFGNEHHTSHKIALSLRRFIDVNQDLSSYENSSVYLEQLQDPNYKYMATAAHVGTSRNFPQVTEFCWDLVRKVSLQLKQELNNNKLLSSLAGFFNNYDKVDDNRAFYTDNMAKPNKADATKLSNLGVFTFPNDKWTITDMIFAQDVMPYSCEFMLNIISTPTGGMNLVWSYFELDQVESVDPYVEKFRENILKYVE